eukprot:gene16012-biopygen16126
MMSVAQFPNAASCVRTTENRTSNGTSVCPTTLSSFSLMSAWVSATIESIVGSAGYCAVTSNFRTLTSTASAESWPCSRRTAGTVRVATEKWRKSLPDLTT